MPKVINGLFDVPKGEAFQRLIIGAQEASNVFEDAPELELPNQSTIPEMHLKKK